MKFHQLFYFKVLAENNHLTRSADMLSISPPALRRAIRDIEEEYHCTLFDKNGRRIELNQNGVILLRHAENIMRELDSIRSDLSEASERQNDSSFQIGVSNPTLWRDEIAAFMKLNPNAFLGQSILNTAQLKDVDYFRKLDIVISGGGDFSFEEWNSACLISKNPPVLIVPRGHRLFDKKSIRLMEAKEEHFLRMPKNTSEHKWEEDMFRLAGSFPRRNSECDFSMCPTLLSTGNYVYLTSELIARSGGFGDARIIPVSEPIMHRPYFIYWHKNRTPNKMACTFRDFIIEMQGGEEKTLTKTFYK